MERVLASVQQITNLSPIKGADRIELATVLGWKCVVPRGVYQIGDHIVYFEVDSALPADDPRYEQFHRFGLKTLPNGDKGIVIKTKAFKGQISQGLVMSLNELNLPDDLPIGYNCMGECRVTKYNPISQYKGSAIIGDFDTRYAAITDSMRVQNLIDHWDELCRLDWCPTLKLDGQSRTIAKNKFGEICVFSRTKQIANTDTVVESITTYSDILEHMPTDWAIQGEFVGPRIQSNRLKLTERRFYIFAVWNNGERVPRDKWPTWVYAHPHIVPIIKDVDFKHDFDSTLDAITDVCRDNITPNCLDEGIVYHYVGSNDDYPDWLHNITGRNQSIKIINPEYLVKHTL